MLGAHMRITSDTVVLHSETGLSVCPATITVDGPMILAVEPGLAEPAPDVVSLKGHLIAPAFVNGHTHVVLSCLRGLSERAAYRGNIVEEVYFPFEKVLTREDVRAFARMGALDCMLSGTGAVWDHYYYGDAVAEALVDVGLTGVVAPTLQDLAGPGRDQWEAALQTTADLATDARFEAHGIFAACGPHATDTVSDALWERTASMATEYDLPIHAHVAQSFEEYARSLDRHGETPLGRLRRLGCLVDGLRFLLVHGLYVNQDDLNRLVPDSHLLGFCPYSQLQFAFPAAVQAWRSAGLSIALGTDTGCCNDTMNVQLEVRSLASGPSFAVADSASFEKFLQEPTLAMAEEVAKTRQQCYEELSEHGEPGDALSAVWTAAGTFHPKLKLGRLAAGFRANLLAVDLSHPALWPAQSPIRSLALSEVAPAIHGLMVNGKWQGELGDFHRSVLGSDKVRAFRIEADRRMEEVLKRAGIA